MIPGCVDGKSCPVESLCCRERAYTLLKLIADERRPLKDITAICNDRTICKLRCSSDITHIPFLVRNIIGRKNI